jgi:hypothetical protein
MNNVLPSFSHAILLLLLHFVTKFAALAGIFPGHVYSKTRHSICATGCTITGIQNRLPKAQQSHAKGSGGHQTDSKTGVSSRQ